jgi:hypothetical protein
VRRIFCRHIGASNRDNGTPTSGVSTHVTFVLIGIKIKSFIANILTNGQRIALSIGPNWIGSAWRRRHIPVSDTSCFKRLFPKATRSIESVSYRGAIVYVFTQFAECTNKISLSFSVFVRPSTFKTLYSVLNTCHFLKSSKSLHVSAWIGHPQVLIIVF